MKILIVGSDLNSILIAKYIKMQSNKHDIYITAEIGSENKYYTPIGIKENDISSILDFVKYNQIDFTIVNSGIAVINGIADLFNKEELPIAAPFAEGARITFFNSIAKKVMYKLKINTPRFGIFDRENIATEYIRKGKFPIVLMNDFTLNGRKCDVYTSYKRARLELQKIFENDDEKIVVETYMAGKIVYLYFLTDGYNAIPLISIERKGCKNFTQIKAPSLKINDKLLKNILRNAVFPVLDDIEKYAGSYSGILGMKVKVKDNAFWVLEYYNGFQDHDLQAFLSLLDDDLAQLFYEVATRQLGNRNIAELYSKSSYTLAFPKDNIAANIDEDDLFITEDDKNIIITKIASTMNYAKEELEDYLEIVCKKEIFKEIKETTKEVLRI